MHTNAEVDLVVEIKLPIVTVSMSCARQGVPGRALWEKGTQVPGATALEDSSWELL